MTKKVVITLLPARWLLILLHKRDQILQQVQGLKLKVRNIINASSLNNVFSLLLVDRWWLFTVNKFEYILLVLSISKNGYEKTKENLIMSKTCATSGQVELRMTRYTILGSYPHHPKNYYLLWVSILANV